MANPKFSISQALSFGWNTMKKNLGFFIVLIIILIVVSAIPNSLTTLTQKDYPALALIFTLVSLVLNIILEIGVTNISLKFAQGEKPTYNDLFSKINLFLNFLGGSILFGLIVMVGLFLFVIPGIYWALKYQFYAYLIVDKGMGPIEALKESGRITQDAKWSLLGLYLLVLLINIAGALVLLVGLFATIPTTMVAYAAVYKKLSGQAIPSLKGSTPKQPGIQAESEL